MKRTPLKRKTPLRSWPKEPVYRVPTDRHPPFEPGQLKRQQAMQRKPKLARKPMPKQSPKMKALMVEYRAAKATWWEQHDGRCEMMLTRYVNGEERLTRVPATRCGNLIGLPYPPQDRCRRRANKEPHHMKLRGPFLCDISTYFGCCSAHHRWIHDNANEARRLGYLIRPTPHPTPTTK